MTIQKTLEEREKRYGEFRNQSYISQAIRHAMRDNDGWQDLNYLQREALEMIAHKIARILNGDPNYIDNWHDIAGYATLVENELKENE